MAFANTVSRRSVIDAASSPNPVVVTDTHKSPSTTFAVDWMGLGDANPSSPNDRSTQLSQGSGRKTSKSWATWIRRLLALASRQVHPMIGPDSLRSPSPGSPPKYVSNTESLARVHGSGASELLEAELAASPWSVESESPPQAAANMATMSKIVAFLTMASPRDALKPTRRTTGVNI